jgi:transcriptional regulator with PAS, ATPase and Fis domain
LLFLTQPARAPQRWGITNSTGPAAPRQFRQSLSLDSIIRHHVENVLELSRGNRLRAARQLHISRPTLYRVLANETILSH